MNMILILLLFIEIIIFQSSIFIICSKTSLSICKSESHKYLASFIVQRWLDARLELGFLHNYNNDEDNISFTNLINNLTSIYMYNSGLVVTHNRNSLVPYARIFKCGNEAIGYNLDHLAKSTIEKRKNGQWKIRRSHALLTQNQFESYLTSFISLDKIDITPIFTFVRDPIEHFLSGFSELMYRSYNNPNSKNKKKALDGVSNYQMTIEDTKDTIRSIFNFDHKSYSKLAENHIYPMSGTFFEFNISIIGHLEHFTQDWESIIVPTYNLTGTFDKRYGTHPTSQNHPWIQHKQELLKDSKTSSKYKILKNLTITKNFTTTTSSSTHDPNNARTSLKEIFKTDKSFLRAICHFVLIDYICIDSYSLPENCQFLNKTVELAKITIINKKTVNPKVIN